MNKLKILIVSNTDATICRFRKPIIDRLMSDNHSVITISGDTGYTEDLKEMTTKNYSLDMYRNERIGAVIKNLLFSIKILKQEKPDIVHGFTHYGNLIVGVGSLFVSTKKSYMNITGMGKLFSNKGIYYRMLQFFLLQFYKIFGKRCTKIFVQNKHDTSLFIKLLKLPKKIIYQPGSGVFLPVQKYRLQKNEKISVIMASRTSKEKGSYIFLEAAKIITELDEHQNYTFEFVGGHSLNQPFDNDFSKLSEESGVIYSGYTKNIEEKILNADIVVLPSMYREGIPRILLEALSYDKYIITTKMPGCEETVINGWNGIIIPQNNVNALVASILCTNRSLLDKSSGRSRKLCEKYFSAKIIVDRVIHEYFLEV